MSKTVIIEVPADFEATETNAHKLAISTLAKEWQRAEEDAKRTGEPFCPIFPENIYLVDKASILPPPPPESTDLKTHFKIVRTLNT
jgi:hypothetical protein